MKKLSMALLVAFVGVGLFGCSHNKSKKTIFTEYLSYSIWNDYYWSTTVYMNLNDCVGLGYKIGEGLKRKGYSRNHAGDMWTKSSKNGKTIITKNIIMLVHSLATGPTDVSVTFIFSCNIQNRKISEFSGKDSLFGKNYADMLKDFDNIAIEVFPGLHLLRKLVGGSR